MSLLDIGSRCSHPACSEIDFLPIVCRCNKPYCRHHISSESHQCSAASDPSSAIQYPFDKLRRCNASNCFHPSLNAFTSSQDVIPTCNACNQSFCAAHRHPSSHLCPVLGSPSSEKANTAHVLLAKHFPASSSRKTTWRTPKVPTDPAKLARFRQVELIKMRHRAIPGDNKEGPHLVPFEQRLHLRFNKGSGDPESVLWFRKTMVAGKILDSLAILAKVKSSEQSPLQLSKILDNGDTEVLLNDLPIGDQVEDGDKVIVSSVVFSPNI